MYCPVCQAPCGRKDSSSPGISQRTQFGMSWLQPASQVSMMKESLQAAICEMAQLLKMVVGISHQLFIVSRCWSEMTFF